jgi:2-polyprenyl-6-methoxyphenol hydroxylase-like FAD-dependent oxidoreductase
MTAHAVVIAGGGPTGLMLAGELALAGVDVVIVERRATQDVDGSRAGALHSRTIEVLDQRGIAERFLAAGEVAQVQGFAGIHLDISDFPTRHNYGLALWQSDLEPILADWVGELGVPTLRSREVVGFAQGDTGVDVELSRDTTIRAEYLVGCDGGRSLIRKAAGAILAIGSNPASHRAKPCVRHLGEKPPSVTAKRRPKPLPPSRRNHPMNDTAPTTRWSAVCAKPLARRAGIDTSPPEVIHAEAKARAKQPLRRAWLARHGRPDQFRDCNRGMPARRPKKGRLEESETQRARILLPPPRRRSHPASPARRSQAFTTPAETKPSKDASFCARTTVKSFGALL